MDNIKLFQQKCEQSVTALLVKSDISADAGVKSVECRRQLRKKLKTANKANETLEAAISTKNTEIHELKKAVDSLNSVINSVPIEEIDKGTASATSKIIELRKLNKQLKSDIEISKVRTNKLEVKIKKIESELSKAQTSLAHEISENKNKHAQSTIIETLQNELSLTKQKLFEALNLNTELKNNLKIAQKCIHQEVGENISFHEILNSNSSWRGRQQQIISLQTKLSDLKEKLSYPSRFESQQVYEVRKLESTRRAEIDDLNNNIKNLQQIIEDQKNKMSALKLRNHTLIQESTAYKEKTLNLIEKSGISDNSMSILNEKLAIQKTYYEGKMKQIVENYEEKSKEQMKDKHTYVQLQEQIEDLYGTIVEKDKLITELHEKLHKAEQELKDVAGDFLYSCRDLKKSEFLAILDSLEIEKNDLVKYNRTLIERLESERDKISQLNEQNSQMKVKISRLEHKIKEIDLCNVTVGINQKEQKAIYEKQKRNQRIAEFTSSMNSSRMGSIIFENQNLNDPLNTGSLKANEMETLRNRLELFSEKVTFLEDKLNYISLEKDTDEKRFQEIIQNTKTNLLDTICQIKRIDTANEFESAEFIQLESSV